MTFLTVLIIPLIVAIVGFFLFKGITWKEFLLHAGIQLVIATLCTLALLYHNVWYTEVWNSYVTSKNKEKVSCEHSYPCNPHPCMCDKNGCSTCWDTCYSHSYDIDWAVYDNTQRRWRIKRIDRQGLKEPQRWSEVEIGNPTSHTHSYKNYLKVSNTSVYREDRIKNLVQKYIKILPEYPIKIYDYYKLNRFIDVNNIWDEHDRQFFNEQLSEVNGRLGAKKQCNIIMILTLNTDKEYFDALNNYWEGFNKNDIAIVLDVDKSLKINWVKIKTLSQSELVNVKLRDDILDLKKFKFEKLIKIIETDVEKYYQRKRMRDFEYLMDNMVIEWWQYLICIIIGVIASGTLVYWLHKEDLFDEEK